MSDPLGALSGGANPHRNRDQIVSAASEVFRRRLLAHRNQSLIVNPTDNTTPLPPPPPPPPPEYAPKNPPRRGTVQGHSGVKPPVGLVASSDGGRNVTSQLIPTTQPAPKSFAAAAAAVEQRLMHKTINGSGSNGNGDPHNGGGGDVTSPNRHSIGYRPRQRQPSSDAPGRPTFALLTTIRQNFELVKSRTFCQCMFFTSFWHMPLMSSKEESGVVELDWYLPTPFLKI